jgi:hypothetical protein
MGQYVIGFADIDRTMHARVGGKAASLGELVRIEGIRVPDGFVVTTEAFADVVSDALRQEIARWLARTGESDAYAVRSSATAPFVGWTNARDRPRRRQRIDMARRAHRYMARREALRRYDRAVTTDEHHV